MGMSLSKLLVTVKDRGAWHAALHGVTKSQTWLSDWITATKSTGEVFGYWRWPINNLSSTLLGISTFRNQHNIAKQFTSNCTPVLSMYTLFLAILLKMGIVFKIAINPNSLLFYFTFFINSVIEHNMFNVHCFFFSVNSVFFAFPHPS